MHEHVGALYNFKDVTCSAAQSAGVIDAQELI